MKNISVAFFAAAFIGIVITAMPYLSDVEVLENEHSTDTYAEEDNIDADDAVITTRNLTNNNQKYPAKIDTSSRNRKDTTNNNSPSEDAKIKSPPLLSIENIVDFNQLSEEGLSKEITSIEDLLDRYGVIEGLNSNAYSEDERAEINEAIAYLNRLRIEKVDNSLNSIRNSINDFHEDIKTGKYPPPKSLSTSEIDKIKQKHMEISESKNKIIQIKIDELLAHTDQESLNELGIP